MRKINVTLFCSQLVFYIQDSDDVYGQFSFHPKENQSIQSQPDGRFLSLSFLRVGGTLGEVRLSLTVLYIPARPLESSQAREGVLNGTSINSVLFSSGQSRAQLILPIRNDAFLQNGARFLIQVGYFVERPFNSDVIWSVFKTNVFMWLNWDSMALALVLNRKHIKTLWSFLRCYFSN